MSKVYKSRQKLNFEQAGQYYKFAFNIGLEHGKFTERERIIKILEDYLPDYHYHPTKTIPELSDIIKGEQK